MGKVLVCKCLFGGRGSSVTYHKVLQLCDPAGRFGIWRWRCLGASVPRVPPAWYCLSDCWYSFWDSSHGYQTWRCTGSHEGIGKGGVQRATLAYFWRPPAPLPGPQACGQQSRPPFPHSTTRHLDSKRSVLQVTSRSDVVSEHALSWALKHQACALKSEISTSAPSNSPHAPRFPPPPYGKP